MAGRQDILLPDQQLCGYSFDRNVSGHTLEVVGLSHCRAEVRRHKSITFNNICQLR